MKNYEKEMILNAINTHIDMLYRSAEDYKRNGNTDALKDCLNEVRKYNELKKSI